MNVARPQAGRGLAARFLTAQLVVIAAGSFTLAMVAVAVAPALFAAHLDRAGETDATVRQHAEEAFGYAVGLSLLVAAAVSVFTALAVSALMIRRLTAPVTALAAAADTVAAGEYRVDVPPARIGGEFDRLTAAFTHMADRLATSETRRRRLLADLAHELRTPLTTLGAHVDGLDDDVVPAGPATWEVMRGQIERLQRLIDDITQLSAAEEHALDLHLTRTDLGRIAAAAADAASAAYQAQGVGLSVDAQGPVPVVVDPGRIQQVLANLLDNALRHTPRGGRVRVRTRLDGATAFVEVMDDGAGLPAAELEAVFERFHRADPARSRAGGGSGLGLTIARAIATDHQGTLAAHSDGLGAGAVFTLRLPAASGQAEVSARKNTEPMSAGLGEA